MRFPFFSRTFPLRHSIPVLVLLFGLAWTGLSAVVHLILERRDARELVLQRASNLANRLARKAKNDSLRQRERKWWEWQAKELVWAVVCDSNLKVLSSTEEGWSDGPLMGRVAPEAVELARAMLEANAPRQMVGPSRQVWAARSVLDSTDGPPARMVLVQASLDRALAAGYHEVWLHVLVSTAAQTVGCILLWWVLRRFMNQRMSQIVKAEGSSLLQAVGVQPDLGGSTDEFSEIVRIFKESGSRLEQIANNIEDVFFLTTPEKRVVYVSPAYTRLFGQQDEELKGDVDAWKMPVLPEYHHDLWHVSDPLMEGAPSVKTEFRIRQVGGRIRWVELRMFPVRDERGKLIYMAGLSRDVTERKELEQEILNVSERERRRIGADIHDDLCQQLAATKFKCELLLEDLRSDGSRLVPEAAEILALVGDSTKRSRLIARGLSPMELVGEGFAVGIDKLVKATQSLHKIDCYFYSPHTVLVESPTAAVHLYRITQEFLNNAVRHGKPATIEVRLEMNMEFLRIEVLNDGNPYKEPSDSNPGMGLKIQRYRGDAIGAHITIQPRPDGVSGTLATCIAPHSTCNPENPSTP